MGKHIVLGMLVAVALLMHGCGAPDRAAQPAAPAAIAPTAQPPQQAPIPGDQLYVRDRDTSAAEHLAILSSDGTRTRDLPLGAIAPDRSILYTAESSPAGDGPKTRVRALDLKTGKQIRETTIGGAYSLPTVSVDELPGGLAPDGNWLVLRKAPGLASAPSQSQFVVLDTAFARPARHVNLGIDGLYEFDGISNSGNVLYLVQYLSSPSLSLAAPYQVRYYDMAQKLLDPNPVVMKGEEEVMAGTHHTSVPAPNGVWRYSLYMNNSHGPFIHALNLNDRYAICIDLPTEGKDDAARQMFWSLAISPDGKTLYAANGALGLVSEIDISQNGGFPVVQRSASLPPTPAASAGPLDGLAALFAAPVAEAKPEHGSGMGGAVLAPDGKTLFAIGDSGLLAIGTADLKEYRRYLPDTALGSVAISADGKRLYATDAGQERIILLDLATGAPLAEIAGMRSAGSILWVESHNR
jgi:hypothetical protein